MSLDPTAVELQLINFLDVITSVTETKQNPNQIVNEHLCGYYLQKLKKTALSTSPIKQLIEHHKCKLGFRILFTYITISSTKSVGVVSVKINPTQGAISRHLLMTVKVTNCHDKMFCTLDSWPNFLFLMVVSAVMMSDS